MRYYLFICVILLALGIVGDFEYQDQRAQDCAATHRDYDKEADKCRDRVKP